MRQIGYRNSDLNQLLFECLIDANFNFPTLHIILTSFASLEPARTEYFTTFAQSLHNQLQEASKLERRIAKENPALLDEKVPDTVTFINFWFILARFASGLSSEMK